MPLAEILEQIGSTVAAAEKLLEPPISDHKSTLEKLNDQAETLDGAVASLKKEVRRYGLEVRTYAALREVLDDFEDKLDAAVAVVGAPRQSETIEVAANEFREELAVFNVAALNDSDEVAVRTLLDLLGTQMAHSSGLDSAGAKPEKLSSTLEVVRMTSDRLFAIIDSHFDEVVEDMLQSGKVSVAAGGSN